MQPQPDPDVTAGWAQLDEPPEPVRAVAALLASAGLPERLAPAVAARWEGAAGVLGADPWQLLAVPGVRPDQADALARALDPGVRPDDRRRDVALAGYVLARAARDGHTVVPAAVLHAALGGLGVPDASGAVDGGRAQGVLSLVVDSEGGEAAALPPLAGAEEALAAAVARLVRHARPFPLPVETGDAARGLGEVQLAALHAVAQAGLTMLAGGPGTGRGRTIAAVRDLAAAGGVELVEVRPGDAGGPVATASIVVVREAEQLDLPTAVRVLARCPEGAHVLLVGDPAMLTPAAPGRVLADLAASGCGGVLTLPEVRAVGPGARIAGLAHAVASGVLPGLDPGDREVVSVPAADDEIAARRVAQLVTTSIPRAFGVPASDVQVIAPTARGPAGTVALNVALKDQLNVGPGAVHGFDPGDRVVAVADLPGTDVTRGQAGTVLAVDGGLLVAFADREVRLPAWLLDGLRHGWAVSVHLAGTRQWPDVVAVLPARASGTLSRPLVYTAVTRASRHLSVVHSAGAALVRAVQEVDHRPRRTRLAGLVRAALAAGPPADEPPDAAARSG